MTTKEPINSNEEVYETPFVLYLFIGVLVICVLYMVGFLIFSK